MRHSYSIQNIRCGGCANTITKKMTEEGFQVIEVSPEQKSVTIETTSEDMIDKGAEVLKRLGYPLADEESGFVDKAKSFVSCAIGKIS